MTRDAPQHAGPSYRGCVRRYDEEWCGICGIVAAVVAARDTAGTPQTIALCPHHTASEQIGSPVLFHFGYEAETDSFRWIGEGGRVDGAGSSLLAHDLVEAVAVLAWTISEKACGLGGWWVYRQPEHEPTTRDEHLSGVGPPEIPPHPLNMVCAKCGSAEVECLDWVRMNDDLFIGGSQILPAADHWCSVCEIHEEPIEAREYCETKGHSGTPCRICGTATNEPDG